MRLMQAFPHEERQRITSAVRDAESGTAGEVVVVLAEESDAYEEASWRGAALAGGGVLVLDLGYRHAAPFWLPLPANAALLIGLAAAALAFWLVPKADGLRRRLVSRAARVSRVRTAAQAAFHVHRVSATRERTGVLVYVSLFEREVVVLPDLGIEAKAPESAWAEVMGHVVRGMTAGQPADGVVDAVRACGGLLRAAGFAARPDDQDELANAPILSPR
jgi:putative membrane protein